MAVVVAVAVVFGGAMLFVSGGLDTFMKEGATIVQDSARDVSDGQTMVIVPVVDLGNATTAGDSFNEGRMEPTPLLGGPFGRDKCQVGLLLKRKALMMPAGFPRFPFRMWNIGSTSSIVQAAPVATSSMPSVDESPVSISLPSDDVASLTPPSSSTNSGASATSSKDYQPAWADHIERGPGCRLGLVGNIRRRPFDKTDLGARTRPPGRPVGFLRFGDIA